MFNTDEPKMRAFNKETNIKMSEFLNSQLYIYFDILLTEWIDSPNMTEDEKKENQTHETTGGYLKKYEYKEAWSNWWLKNKSDEMIERINKLPNFDSKIFEEITGIDISVKEEMVDLGNGKKVSLSTVKEALKNHIS